MGVDSLLCFSLKSTSNVGIALNGEYVPALLSRGNKPNRKISDS